MVEDALRHGQGPLTDVDSQEQFPLGLHGDPDPVRGARTTDKLTPCGRTFSLCHVSDAHSSSHL